MFGHQSRNHFTIQTKLNHKIDSMGKYSWGKYIESTSKVQVTPTKLGIGTVSHNGKLITSKAQQTLYNSILHDNLISWYVEKYNIPIDFLRNNSSIKAFQRSRKECGLGIEIFITKSISSGTVTGRIMVQRKIILHSNLPRCNAPDEHTTHVL